MPLGPDQEYIVEYNSYQLPGYAQLEDDPSDMNIQDHYAFGWDGSLSQYAGLSNKSYKMRFLVWEATYRACKDQYHTATTILRSRKEGFAPLRVDYDDRYFEATVKSISYSQEASASKKILRYDVEFDTLPWMVGIDTKTLTGAGNIDTDQVTRTLDDGGWTPVNLVVSGTNPTVSGFTATEQFTGFVSISGVVSGFEIDTESFTSTNNALIAWRDFGLWVGTGKTNFVTTGVSAITVTYKNRWY